MTKKPAKINPTEEEIAEMWVLRNKSRHNKLSPAEKIRYAEMLKNISQSKG